MESVGGTHEITSHQKRAQKMFYKVWNGTVKHIKSVLFEQKKPVEIPGFAIFAPVLSTHATHHDGQQTDHSGKPLKQRGGEIDYILGNSRDFKAKSVQVKLIMHNDFLTKCGDQVQLPTNGNQESHNVIVVNLDQEQAGESQSVFHILSEKYGLRGLKQVNFNGIAKVCHTDIKTVDLILKEIVATMVREGCLC